MRQRVRALGTRPQQLDLHDRHAGARLRLHRTTGFLKPAADLPGLSRFAADFRRHQVP